MNRTLTAKLHVNKRTLFDNKDQINAVILSVEAEHNGYATESIYLKQGHLIKNTKEQVDAHLKEILLVSIKDIIEVI